ncbi:MAG: YIP1 family protein [Pseudomonadota bacterium]
MTLFDSLYAQGLRAIREPRAAAADILALGVPFQIVLSTLVLLAILSVLLDTLLFAVMGNVEVETQPFRSLVVYLAITGVFSLVVTLVGRWFGGLGSIEDALLLVAFLQAMLLPASALQVVLALVSPDLAVLFIFGVALFLFWIQVNFVAALHGFQSLGRAFAVTLIASFIVAFAVAPFTVPETMSMSDV